MRAFVLRWGGGLLEGLVLGAVLLATFLRGGVPPFSYALVFVLLALAFCLWGALRLIEASQAEFTAACQGGDSAPLLPPPHWRSRLITVLLPVCAMICILQTVPLPAGVVGWLSPQRAALAARIARGFGQDQAPRWLTLSADGAATRESLLLVLQAIFALWLGCCLGGRRRRARRMVFSLILLVVAEALYGLAGNLVKQDHALSPQSLLQFAHGSFVNRNHFAGLLALFIPVAVGWFFYRAMEPLPGTRFRHYRMPGVGQVLTERRGLWLVAPVILVLGVIQSASRGGFASMLAGVAVFFVMTARRRLSRTLAWLAAALSLVILAFALNSDYEVVLGRFDQMTRENREEGRLVVWRDSLPMARDFALVGVGLGNFGSVFKLYDTMDTHQYYAQAHNEWLEAWLTLGLVGFLPFILLVLGLFRAMLRTVRQAGDDQPWLLGGFCGLLGLALHGFVEFNFHIPGITIAAALLGGLLLGFQPRTKKTPPLGDRH